jgi:signal recognition particle subunit SRP54
VWPRASSAWATCSAWWRRRTSKVDQDKAAKLARKLQKGKGFDLEDFRDQLQQMLSMGGMSSLLDKLPGVANLPKGVKEQANDRDLHRMVAVINSMTPQERRHPDIIKASRRKRIATGSGTQVQDVNKLLKQFMQMQKMMKKMSKGGMAKMMRGLKGRMPTGLPF